MKIQTSLPILTVLFISIFIVTCKKQDPAKPASINTKPATNITTTSASGGGIISSDGGGNVTARGICWSTDPYPNTLDSHTTDGTGIGEFVCNMDGLTAGTTYHVRAYATNSVSTCYGHDLTFTTLGGKPIVVTLPATNVAVDSATLNGTVNANYFSSVVTFEYGLTAEYDGTITAIQSPV